MPISWIEKNTSFRVKQWAYDLFKSGEVLFSGVRGKQGIPVVAEITVTDEDVKNLTPDLNKAITIIIFSEGISIDDPSYDFQIEELEFRIKCVD